MFHKGTLTLNQLKPGAAVRVHELSLCQHEFLPAYPRTSLIIYIKQCLCMLSSALLWAWTNEANGSGKVIERFLEKII